jgi:hypothetical protein
MYEQKWRALASMTRQEAHRRLDAVHDAALACQQIHARYCAACQVSRTDADVEGLRTERDRASARLSRAQAALDDALRVEWLP